MQHEIAEIIEIYNDADQIENIGDTGRDEIEIGLEVVASKIMRSVMEELKSSSEPWVDVTGISGNNKIAPIKKPQLKRVSFRPKFRPSSHKHVPTTVTIKVLKNRKIA